MSLHSEQLQQACWADIVWDQYKENSLKSQTEANREKGVRRRADGAAGRCKQSGAVHLLGKAHLTPRGRKSSVTTGGEDVLMNIPRDTIRLAPCNHGEAATRMILHLADAVDEGYNNALSRTVDTDVVVLAVAGAAKLNIQKMWLAFGKGP